MILIAAHTFYLFRTLPKDEHREEMLRPFVQILTTEDNKRNWLLDTNSLLLKSRNDFERSKTKEQSIIYFQGIIDSFRNQGSSVQSKADYFFAINFPLRWELMKELSEFFKDTGCFMTAFEMLKDIGLGEEAVTCLFMAGRQTQAIKLAEEYLE